VFDISVNDVVPMAVLDGGKELKEQPPCLRIRQLSLLVDVGQQLAALTVFHNNINPIVRLDDIEELHDVGVAQLHLYLHLSLASDHLGRIHQVLL